MESMEENVAILLESAAERIENLARRIMRKSPAGDSVESLETTPAGGR